MLRVVGQFRPAAPHEPEPEPAPIVLTPAQLRDLAARGEGLEVTGRDVAVYAVEYQLKRDGTPAAKLFEG